MWRASYQRWRLFRLVAPGLPYPPGPLYADLGIDPTPEHLREQMVTIRIPRHHPLPGEDELRRRFGESVEGREDAHLDDWKRLSAAGNTGKGGLQRYTRLFALQHYWRVLHQWHSWAFHRRQVGVKAAFAEVFGVRPSTIHSDLLLCRRQLGEAF